MWLEDNGDGEWAMGVGWAHESYAAIKGKVVCVCVRAGLVDLRAVFVR